jgi:hypothetical protein
MSKAQELIELLEQHEINEGIQFAILATLIKQIAKSYDFKVEPAIGMRGAGMKLKVTSKNDPNISLTISVVKSPSGEYILTIEKSGKQIFSVTSSQLMKIKKEIKPILNKIMKKQPVTEASTKDSYYNVYDSGSHIGTVWGFHDLLNLLHNMYGYSQKDVDRIYDHISRKGKYEDEDDRISVLPRR